MNLELSQCSAVGWRVHLLVLLVVVDLVVPEKSLVTISEEEVLGADVLVGVLGPLGSGVHFLLVGDVLPMGVPSDLCVDRGDDDARNGDIKRQLAPELARLLGVLGNAGTLAVELVVLGTSKLLGGLGAVVAAAGAEGCAGNGHALRRAGKDALGEHDSVVWVEWRVESIECVRGRWGLGGIQSDAAREVRTRSKLIELLTCLRLKRNRLLQRDVSFSLTG